VGYFLHIKTAEFIGAFVEIKQLPKELIPEIAMVGRSNVGKSSLINKVLNRKRLAKSSSTPGKTRTINYYLVNREWYMVDLPGYGYAKVSKAEKQKWGKMIESYLYKRKQLIGVIQLLDIRHIPNENDMLMQSWLTNYSIPILVVATKADKISKGARQKQISLIRKAMDIRAEVNPIVFSAQTGEGTDEILESINSILP
jgi:GTP-binding protein